MPPLPPTRPANTPARSPPSISPRHYEHGLFGLSFRLRVVRPFPPVACEDEHWRDRIAFLQHPGPLATKLGSHGRGCGASHGLADVLPKPYAGEQLHGPVGGQN
ncbi:hypothetical protein B0H19DRAFT_1139482 [Mycena capillaripes]|nr:hypothetical protein B0H19DRAFT_1139482 [Mycena capillaripes]